MSMDGNTRRNNLLNYSRWEANWRNTEMNREMNGGYQRPANLIFRSIEEYNDLLTQLNLPISLIQSLATRRGLTDYQVAAWMRTNLSLGEFGYGYEAVGGPPATH